MANNPAAPIVASLNSWAVQCGKEYRAIERALARIGVDARKPIHARDIFRAMFGEEEESRRRLISAEADLKEQKAARARGEIFYWPEVQKVITQQIVLPISQFIDNIPSTYDVRCNPHDPQLARETLQQLADDLKKTVRDKLPDPRKET